MSTTVPATFEYEVQGTVYTREYQALLSGLVAIYDCLAVLARDPRTN